jgi:hypothetical protein
VRFTVTAPGLVDTPLVDGSGLRGLLERCPKAVFADPRHVAEEIYAAALAGQATFTHGWFNRLSYGFQRHLPTRFGYRLMAVERERVTRHLARTAKETR